MPFPAGGTGQQCQWEHNLYEKDHKMKGIHDIKSGRKIKTK